jgi:phosphoglycolate phosphatase-like HAD superfamily hydrolase
MPTLLALDFDGVICDGLIEYFQTAWRVYCQIWKPTDSTPPSGLAEQFYRLRPVVETGWEMPVVLRSLLVGQSEADLLDHWPTISQERVTTEHLNPKDIEAAVDQVRDQWIAADLDNWLDQHRFYPGIAQRLQQMLAESMPVVIITTKEGRFARKLLQKHGIEMAENQIFGKEVRQPKAQTLRDLLAQTSQPASTKSPSIWFVEDRLKTLQGIKPQTDLASVQLFLADWGYNTPGDRDLARQDERIHLLSLEQFSQDFSRWQHS